MHPNDLKVLTYASKATIVIAVEEMDDARERPWWKRIFGGEKHDRFNLCPEFEAHPDVISIRKLTEEGYLHKGNTEEISHVLMKTDKRKVERRIKKDTYTITIKGREKLAEISPEKDKVVNLNDFKNGNCPF